MQVEYCGAGDEADICAFVCNNSVFGGTRILTMVGVRGGPLGERGLVGRKGCFVKVLFHSGLRIIQGGAFGFNT